MAFQVGKLPALEFKAVFVAAMEDGILPHNRSLFEDGSTENQDALEEERRLMYVAMTRASDRLYLTSAMSRRGQGTLPSRFIDELPEECLVRSSVEEERSRVSNPYAPILRRNGTGNRGSGKRRPY